MDKPDMSESSLEISCNFNSFIFKQESYHLVNEYTLTLSKVLCSHYRFSIFVINTVSETLQIDTAGGRQVETTNAV